MLWLMHSSCSPFAIAEGGIHMNDGSWTGNFLLPHGGKPGYSSGSELEAMGVKIFAGGLTDYIFCPVHSRPALS